MTFSKRYAKNNLGSGQKKPEPKKSRENFRAETTTRFSQQASRLAVNKKQPEKKPFPWRTYLSLFAFILIIVGIVVTWTHRNQWLFPIKHVALQGNFERVQPMAIQAVVGHYAHGSLLFFDKAGLETQLHSLPWVEQVKVVRLWPKTLMITINERASVARFGENQLLDTNGQLFTPPDMQNMDKLPMIIGPDNRAAQLWQAYQVLNDILKPTNLIITRLEVTPRLAYTLTLNNGVVLYLGSDKVIERLKVFTKVYLKTLTSRSDLMQYADLRYDSGMAVGWKEQPKIKKTSQKAS